MDGHLQAVLSRHYVDALAAGGLAVLAFWVVASAFDLVGTASGTRARDPTPIVL